MFSNRLGSRFFAFVKSVFFGLVVLLQACVGPDISDLERFVATAHEDKKPEIEPLPEIPPFKAFEYDSENEIDPFSAQNIVSQGGEGRSVGLIKRPNSDRRKQPLEQFPLDALKLVGTITKQGVSHVVVQTSEGTALLASVGEFMGQNDGKIKAIIPDEQRIVLVETVLDPAGRWVARDVEITIDE